MDGASRPVVPNGSRVGNRPRDHSRVATRFRPNSTPPSPPGQVGDLGGQGNLRPTPTRHDQPAQADDHRRPRQPVADGGVEGPPRVERHVDHIIDEKTGRIVDFRTPTVVLAGIYCEGAYSLSCPRAFTPYFREAWLEKVDESEAPAKAVAAGQHRL